MEDDETETAKQIDALLAGKAADDDQLAAVDGVDLGNHLDVFHSILKQVNGLSESRTFLNFDTFLRQNKLGKTVPRVWTLRSFAEIFSYCSPELD